MDEQNKLVDGLIDNRSQEHIEDYVGRGRQLASRDDVYLRHAWVGAMKIWNAKLANAVDHKLREDIQAEMLLRGYQPPFELVKEEMKTLDYRSYAPITDSRAQIAKSNAQFAKSDVQKSNMQISNSDTQVPQPKPQIAKSDVQIAKPNASTAKSDVQVPDSDTQVPQPKPPVAKSDAPIGKSDAQIPKSKVPPAKSSVAVAKLKPGIVEHIGKNISRDIDDLRDSFERKSKS
jgi:hypothetical protein